MLLNFQEWLNSLKSFVDGNSGIATLINDTSVMESIINTLEHNTGFNKDPISYVSLDIDATLSALGTNFKYSECSL